MPTSLGNTEGISTSSTSAAALVAGGASCKTVQTNDCLVAVYVFGHTTNASEDAMQADTIRYKNKASFILLSQKTICFIGEDG